MEKLKEEHEIMMKRELDVDEENKMKKSKLEEIMSKI